jgi:hypothetical protein
MLFPTFGIAQDCEEPKECEPTVNDCVAGGITNNFIQIGGEGSMSGQDDPCGSYSCNKPGRLTDGTIAEALYEFEYDGTSELTLVVTNTTCTTATLTDIFFNATAEVTNIAIKPGDWPSSWILNFDQSSSGGTNKADGFGNFDVFIYNTEPLVSAEIKAGNMLTFKMIVTGTATTTACSFTSEGSRNASGNGEKTVIAAAKFQRGVQEGSGFIGTCHDELLIDLRYFEAIPGDEKVTLNWETLSEIDNEGFNILRREVIGPRVYAKINASLIPAQGDPTNGALYTFVDETAVNGVEYRYYLEDLDFFGFNTIHNPDNAVPNDPMAPIMPMAPIYGMEEVPRNVPLTVSWIYPEMNSLKAYFSSNPLFSEKSTLLDINVRGSWKKDNFLTLNKKEMEDLLSIADGNDGVIYWRIAEKTFGPSQDTSQTWRLTFASE